MFEIDLDELRKGLPGFTPIAGSFLAEAAIFCLEYCGHKTGVELNLELDDGQEQISLNWYSELSPDAASTWQDEQELVEYAAVGIALPLILQVTDYSDVQRARKGSSVDFWLGRKDEYGFPILEALLEVSGILKENPGNTLNARLKQKKQQVQRSPYRNLPVYIIVVEFSMPKAKLEKQ
jgi:hypothetical protein